MRAVPVALALTLAPTIAGAETQGEIPSSTTIEPRSTAVVGGMTAPLRKWPDCAAILYGGQQQCTGTLIAPTVVVTAGHCNLSNLDSVLIGANNLNRTSDGEVITVTKRTELRENDMTVLVLSKASRFEPRAIATGWAKFDIANGAKVQIVGYGATNAQASQFSPFMQEVESTITDFDCSTKPGCSNFELGAGGGGIDSCNGDSGGPLYLLTSYGNFLVGVTSRAYANASQPCGQGGIYGRPDQVIDQIEAAAGVPVTHGPEPELSEQLVAIRGDAGEVIIDPADPKETDHTFTITTQPAKGMAAVRDDGTLRVCVAKDAVPGNTDSVVVTVADKADPNRSVAKRFVINVAANDPASGTCDPNAFGAGDDGGGCCDSSGKGAAGSALLSMLALVVLGRRRRR